jgi:hypothetical protein
MQNEKHMKKSMRRIFENIHKIITTMNTIFKFRFYNKCWGKYKTYLNIFYKNIALIENT